MNVKVTVNITEVGLVWYNQRKFQKKKIQFEYYEIFNVMKLNKIFDARRDMTFIQSSLRHYKRASGVGEVWVF